MNKSYKIVWNESVQDWVVASEFASGKKKTKVSRAIRAWRVGLLSGAALLTMPALAEDINISVLHPEDHAASVEVAGQQTLVGGFNSISHGAEGYTQMKLQDAYEQGFLTKDPNYADYIKLENIKLGSQNKVVTYTDETTHTQRSVKVYDSTAMNNEKIADFVVNVTTKDIGSDAQYVDTNVYSVDGAANTLTVDVGKASSDWKTDSQNLAYMIMKGTEANKTTSSMFAVKNGGTLNYDTKTLVHLGNELNTDASQRGRLAAFVGGYTGSFNSVLGAQNVDTFEKFTAYNDALIALVEQGGLTQEAYSAELMKALQTDVKTFQAEQVAKDGDALLLKGGSDRVAYIVADGSGSNVNINADSNIQMYSTEASLIKLQNGATLNNDGFIGSIGDDTKGSIVVNAVDSQVNNRATGVIDVGSNDEMRANFNLGGGKGVGIQATGSSVVNNAGVINVAPHPNAASTTGILASGTGVTVTNTGNINLASFGETVGAYGSYLSTGANIVGGAKMTNSGKINIGLSTQKSLADAQTDVAILTPNTTGVYLTNGTFTNDTNGVITLGANVNGDTGINARGINARLDNQGKIIVNSAQTMTGSSPAQSVAIKVGNGATEVKNTGSIDLNGYNNIGIQVVNDPAATPAGTQAVSSGTININSGVDSASKTANYGIWTEGSGAKTTVQGQVNLKESDVVGVHARDGGTIAIDGGNVNFDAAKTNQTGFYIYGAGSTISSGGSTQEVSANQSTLFRIDGGASFDATKGAIDTLIASGEDSTILLSTGTDDDKVASNINTASMILNVSGKNATGVEVNGGATATIDKTTSITLTGEGATAGVVQGASTNIAGVSTGEGNSVLTSQAVLTSGTNAAAGSLGYKVLTGGTLNHEGELTLTSDDSTGILVNGGTVNNSSDITVKGTAVDIIGGDSEVNNTGTVTATDGTAAYRLSNGAKLALTGEGTTEAKGTADGILLDTGAASLTVKDATINMAEDGSGNGIENKAEISGIKLTSTTINVGNGAGVRTATSLAATNSGTITVNGSGTGLLFEKEDKAGTKTDAEKMSANAVDMSGSQKLVINVESAAGRGMVTNTSGNVKSGVSINVNNAAAGSALVVGGKTANVEQSGNIVSKSSTQAVDINNGFVTAFTNYGDIQSKSASPLVMRVDSDKQGVVFTNEDQASLSGKVQLLGGNNEVILKHGSSANTEFTTGAGDDKYQLKDILETENATIFSSIDGGAGADTLTLDNSVYTLSEAAKIKNMEHVTLDNGSTFTLDNTQLDLTATGSAWDIDSSSTLVMKASKALDFNSHLAGTGLVKVDLGNPDNAFAFTTNNMNDKFAGKVELTNSSFELAGNNTTALSDATLVIGEGNVTTVAKGTQAIGGLAFNGGTAKFDTDTLGKKVSDALVQTSGDLNLSGKGAVQIRSNPVLNGQTLPDNTLNLLAQDDTQTLLQLASSTGTVTGSGGNLTVLDQDGNTISNGAKTTVLQDGNTVANATYNYRITGGDNSDGMYVSYGLTELELLTNAGKALALTAAGLTGAGTDLSAKVTGSGDLAIETGAGNTVSLSNLDNDYQGVTDVRSGTLLMGNDNVMGQTSELRQAAETTVDMNGHSQTVGLLNTRSGATTNLNGGNLTVADGGLVEGALKGAGELNLTGGELTIKGANAELAANTTIASAAQAVLNDVQGLGTGSVVDNGELTLNAATGSLANSLSGKGKVTSQQASDIKLTADNSGFGGVFGVAADSKLSATEQANLGTAAVTNAGLLTLDNADSWHLDNSITGTGTLTKQGTGFVTLGQAAAQYTGTTNINTGGLQLGSEGNSVSLASATVSVAEGAQFGGYGDTAGSVNNAGTFTLGTIAPAPVLLQAKLMAAGAGAGQTFTVGEDLTNSGTINVSAADSGTVGNTLYVKGNYIGNSGTLNLNTQLGDDSSPTDKLVVEGNTSGTTAVAVTNVGGKGATTLNGIEVVSVGGDSAGEFAKKGRIVAGAYDYSLERGKGANANNWYLTNAVPDDGGDGGDGGNITPDGGGDNTPAIRPEGKAYASNIAAANTLFNMTLHDRLGETHYVDAFTGEKKVTSLWLRQVAGHNRSNDGSGQNKTQANRYIVQLGGDVGQWSSDGADRFHLGLMGGYANQKANTRNHANGYSADGSVSGYSAGIYGTWFQDNEEKTGAYVDTWMLYNWFDNTVSSKDGASDSYKSKGITASVETGYTWKVGEKNERESYYVQPQAQVTWMGVEADDVKEANGTHVQSGGDGNVQTRLGMRAFIKGHSKLDNDKDRTFEPFVEANWIHNTNDFSATMDGVSVRQAGTRNIGELKTGVEAKLNKNVNLWGSVGQQMGDHGYSDTQGQVGFKVNF